MSVYPIYLVLGSDGALGAYATEMLLRIDLKQNAEKGEHPLQVYKLNEHMLTVTYEPAREFAEWTEPPWKLCTRHAGEAINALFPFGDQRKGKGVCSQCQPAGAKK